MIDYFTCDTCGETYKGKFILTKEGLIECYDCDKKEIVGDIVWEAIKEDDDVDYKLLRATVEGMLVEDVERIYRAESEYGEDYTKRFLNEDGSIKVEMLYFQQNPIDLVIEGQKIAYSALRYLEGSDETYKELAKKLVDIYKDYREKEFSEEEVKDIWGIYFSEDVGDLIGRDEMWQ